MHPHTLHPHTSAPDRQLTAPGLLGIFAALAALAILGTTLTGIATSFASANHGGQLVSETPRSDTPRPLDGDVWDIKAIGNRVVMGGSFTQVQLPNGQVVDQAHLAAYFLDSGQFDFGFRPVVDRQVEAVAASDDEQFIFIGGSFNTVDGTARAKVAKLTTQGDLITAFRANATAAVKTIAVHSDRVYLGGSFRRVNGVARERLAAVNASNGAVVAGFDFPVETGIGGGGSLSVRALDITPDGSRMLVAHSGLTVGGQDRTGVAMFDVSGAVDVLDPWQTSLYRDNYQRCSGGRLQLRDAEFSPDGSYFVVVGAGNDRPPVCDTAIRWPTFSGAGTQPDWITRNHDSTYSVGISDSAVYIGGHFCYTESQLAPDPWPGETDTVYDCFRNEQVQLGNLVVARNQLAALDPADGHALEWNPGSNAFKGIQALEVIDEGLLVGQDGSRLGGVTTGRAGLFPLDGQPPATTTTTTTTTTSTTSTTTTTTTVPPTGPDTTPPLVAIEAPAAGSAVGSVPNVTGTITDNRSVAAVRITLRNRQTGQWLRADGSLGAWQALPADISSVGAESSAWSIDLTIPPGRWTLFARPTDSSGNNGSTVTRKFVVN